MLNPFQRACAAIYDGGEFAHVADIAEAREVGDTLFAFLTIELSTSEGCHTADEAVRRIGMAKHNLQDVIAAIPAT